MAVLKLVNNVVEARFADVGSILDFVRRYGEPLGLGIDTGERPEVLDQETGEVIQEAIPPRDMPDEIEAGGALYLMGEGWPGQVRTTKGFETPPPPPPSDADRILSPPQFAFLLALTGFDEVWDALEAAVKVTDRVQYAALRAERARSRFRLDDTLGIVAKFRKIAAQIAPDVDLSETAIRAAWEQAEGFVGGAG